MGALALSLFGAAAAARGAAGLWTRLGPWVPSGANAVAVDPVRPHTLYVGSNAGVFRSEDAGFSWRFAGAGIEAYQVTALAINPKTRSTLFAGTERGIFRSTDTGTTWHAVYLADYFTITSLAVDPNQPAIVYGSSVYLGPAGGPLPVGQLLKSVDGGRSWNEIAIAPLGRAVYQVTLDPGPPSTVYAATSTGLYRSVNAGATWSQILPPGPGFSQVFCLAIDPTSPSTFYAGTNSAGAEAVMRSANGGSSWSPAGAGLPNSASSPLVRALAVLRGPPSTVYAATEAGVSKSSDGGTSWTLAASGDEVGIVVALVPVERLPDTLYAPSDLGLFRLHFDVDEASPVDSPFGAPAVRSVVQVPGAPSRLYVATGQGVFKTPNEGLGWTAVNEGLTSLDVTVVAMSPQVPAGCPLPCTTEPPLYAGTANGVFRSTDGGAHWSAINRGLSVNPVVALIVDPSNADVLYVSTAQRGVAKSIDAGSTWTAINTGLSSQNVLALAVDPGNSSTIYAATSIDVFKSVDGGANWTALGAGFAAASLAISPSAPATIYAASSDQVFRTADGGGSWTAASEGLVAGSTLLAAAVDPNSSSRAYVGSASDGFFKTSSAGSAWEALNDGFPYSINLLYPPVSALLPAREDPFKIYAATGQGLFVDTIPPGTATVCTPDSETLCLNGGRFRVRVDWRAVHLGTSGVGHGVRLTSDTGYFWFFQETNVELVIKVLDARSLDGHFWVFYGALSNVEYTITVTDTHTGEEKTYFNPQDTLASVADTAAFPLGGSASSGGEAGMEEALYREQAAFLGMFDGLASRPGAAEAACVPSATALCLNGGRFRLEVVWNARHLGTSGAGQAVPLTSDTGYFWFFQDTNVELVIKVLDARAVFGHFWVFYGALSNVEYTITVTDTETNQVKTYFNPQDTLASVADTAAF